MGGGLEAGSQVDREPDHGFPNPDHVDFHPRRFHLGAQQKRRPPNPADLFIADQATEIRRPQGGKMVFEAVVEAEGLCPPPERTPMPFEEGRRSILAGQVSLDANGDIVGESVLAQARQIWKNIMSVLAAAGSSISDIVKVTYYMQDIREVVEEIEVRKEIFAGRAYPAVTAVQAAALGLPGLKMEVDVLAVTTLG
jgi:2-iminobutanoate/2-iminopropanoate deaminase